MDRLLLWISRIGLSFGLFRVRLCVSVGMDGRLIAPEGQSMAEVNGVKPVNKTVSWGNDIVASILPE